MILELTSNYQSCNIWFWTKGSTHKHTQLKSKTSTPSSSM